MSIQFVQFLQIFIYLLLIFLTFVVKNNKIKLFFVIVILTIFLINPIRFKQEGISKIERRQNYIDKVLPDRINYR